MTSKWQPMESAPRDRTMILAWVPSLREQVVIYWDKRRWDISADIDAEIYSAEVNPSCWQHLPDDPPDHLQVLP